MVEVPGRRKPIRRKGQVGATLECLLSSLPRPAAFFPLSELLLMKAVSGSNRFYLTAIPVLLLGLSLLALTFFGFMGIGRGGGNFAFDMRYLYVAGEMWEGFSSPYNVDAFKESMKSIAGIDSVSYAYPPNSSPLGLLLSAGSPNAAGMLIGALNLASIAFLVYFIHAASRRVPEGDEAASTAVALVASAVMIGNPFTAHVVWMGQTTLIASAFLFGCWLLADRRMDFVAGLLLGLSAFKPQLVFLVGIWFLLDRRWLLLATAAATTLLLSVWPVVANGIDGSWLAWLHSLRDYQGGAYNTLAFKHVFGLRSTLASFGVIVPSLLPLAIAVVAALYWARRRYEGIWLLNIILIVSNLFLYAHDYDVAPVAIMAYPMLMAARGRPQYLALIVFLVCVLFFPQRIWEKLDMELMARTREVSLLCLMGLFLVLCRKPVPAATGLRVSPS